jgi:endonuclease/exonuclease/phosphatase (EEP) superfamily protein YafD
LVEFDGSDKPVLDGLKNDYPYQQSCWEVIACDFAIISKIPLTNPSAKGRWEGPGFIEANLGPEFGNLTVVGTHTTRFPNAVAQFKQVNALAKYLETVPGHLLVMGDFNATPFSRIVQSFANSLELTRQTSLPSWPSTFGFPQLAIDHIFTSSGLRPLDQERIGDNAGSDHYPVSITLAVPTK